MIHTENTLREAIIKKDEKIIEAYARDLAETKISMFKISEIVKATAIDNAVTDSIKGYKKIDLKKKYAKAIPHIDQIVSSSLAMSMWKTSTK
jgi:hypothetical protein